MSEHVHAVVWIDHHEARIFHFNASEADGLVTAPIVLSATCTTRRTASAAATRLRIMSFFSASPMR
jgi:hypothetical protein